MDLRKSWAMQISSTDFCYQAFGVMLCVLAVQVPPAECGEALGSDRHVYSSQKATELLVSSWNDLSTWSLKHEVSCQCYRDVTRAISGYLDHKAWALQMFDAWAKPRPSLSEGHTTFVGGYQQCRSSKAPPLNREEKWPAFGGNYCLVTFRNLTYTDTPTDMVKPFILPFVHLGICMPDTCSEENITNIFQERLQALNVTAFLAAMSTECRTDERELTTFTFIAILVVAVTGALMIAGTIFDVVFIQWPNWAVTNKEDGAGIGLMASLPEKLNNKAGKVLLAFSVYSNGEKLLSTNEVPGSLPVISGMRVLSMAWLQLGHIHLLCCAHIGNIASILSGFLGTRAADLVTGFHFAVDTFFAISGCLVAYGTIPKLQQQGWNIGWGRFFLHRYWRLTPPFIATLVLVQGLQRFLGSGPLWANVQPVDNANCENYWWGSFLYINNLGVDFLTICFPPSWSLAVDFQFHLASPLMLIPFSIATIAGLVSCSFLTLIQWIYTLHLSFSNKWGHRSASIFKGGPLTWLRYYYMVPYCRIGPFAIGVITGYYLAVHKGRIPLSRSVIIFGWVSTAVTAFVLIFGFHGEASGTKPDSVTTSAIMNAMAGSAWGACVCWTIVACSSGYGGPINAILTWSPLLVLSKISYAFYLVHSYVAAIYVGNMENLLYLNVLSYIGTFITLFVMSCIVAVYLVLAVEYPTFNLEPILFGSRNKRAAERFFAGESKSKTN